MIRGSPACATGASAPTPTPIRNRNTINEATLQEVAARKLARPQTIIVLWNAIRLPKRSETVPASRLPTSRPRKVIDTR